MAQIQIPGIIRAGQHTQQGIEGLQNALLTRSRLDTAGLQQQQMGMQKQAMSQDMAKRAELEAVLRTSQNPDRDGFEWARRNDPGLAMKLETHYLQRFGEKASLDLEGAAKELESATGERIEYGERFAKVPTNNGEVVFDKLSQKFQQITDAKGLAELQSDLRKSENLEKHEQALQLEAFRQQGPGREDLTATVYEDFRSTDPARRQRAEDYISRQKQPVTEPGSYLPILDPQGNIRGAWNAKSGSYKQAPVENARKNALPTTEKKATADIESAETKIRNLGALFKPEYVGPIQGRFNLAKIKTPGVPIDKGLAAFVAQNTTLKNEVIKFITGAQMSEPEAQRIMTQIPSVEDKPEVWQAKYDITLQNIQILKQKMKEAGYVFGGGAGGSKAESLRQRYNY